MILAQDDASRVTDFDALVMTLDGVTAAIVAFIFVCLIFPSIVKNRPQFFSALAAVLFVILLHSLNLMIRSPGFQVFVGAMTGLLQVASILLLVLSVGGLTPRQLAGDMARAYEVMRRGEEEKEIIIPLEGGRKDRDDTDRAPVYHIDTEDLPPPKASEPRKPEPPPSIPLE